MDKEKITVSYQGVPGAFSHEAAEHFARLFIAQECVFRPCADFFSVFEQLKQNTSSYGVIPLENSSIGSITAVYDLLWTMKSLILAEFYLPIHHQLLSLENVPLQEIKEVHSHPAALEQCKKFFQANCHIKAVPCYDTAGAALALKESGNKNIAAIASRSTSQKYGLVILQENIEDFAVNTTRFVLVGPDTSGKPLICPVKMTVYLDCCNEAISLGCRLADFESVGARVSKIESRPLASSPWDFRLFVDFAIDSEKTFLACRSLLQGKPTDFTVLGIYSSLKNMQP